MTEVFLGILKDFYFIYLKKKEIKETHLLNVSSSAGLLFP